MLLGITKVLILFPFIPYLIFMITSRNRKLAHVYCGPIVALCNFFILNYLFNILVAIFLTIAYIGVTFYFAKEKTKKKRTPKRFGMNILYFMSWVGLRLYLVLIIIGTILEMMK